MLINFKMRNYKSYKDEINFSMEKANNVRRYKNNVLEINKYKLLKTAVIFGANASGKTNLLIGLRALRYLIINPTQSETSKLWFEPYGNNKQNTEFSVRFLKDASVFDYSLEYNADEIVFEKLRVNEKLFFERKLQDMSVVPSQIKALVGNVRKNQTLLHFAQYNNVSEAKAAFEWFYNNIVYIQDKVAPIESLNMLANKEYKEKILEFLKAADFSIVDLEVKDIALPLYLSENKVEDNNILNNMPLHNEKVVAKRIYCKHKSQDGEFELPFELESAGTQHFFTLALNLLFHNNTGRTILMDEFDASLHMVLSESILKLLNNKDQRNQFIFTTHDISLMDNELRQDQIWFADRNKFGESEIFSMYDFDDPALKRSDFGYKRRYLEGRFGATQIVDEFRLLDLLVKSNGKK